VSTGNGSSAIAICFKLVFYGFYKIKVAKSPVNPFFIPQYEGKKSQAMSSRVQSKIYLFTDFGK
jgi:hypothetical protein